MNSNVLHAVFKRNFVSYFANPTGYVFICVFVLLSSFAAFWPSEFFNANLANLDQLSKVFPFIMLIFIPAITMSVWAEERREGTDELLLTIPAGDFDIVLGKYFAAVAIYTVSLLFSMATNYLVLLSLGDPDVGLYVATYVGYWFVGLAMLAVGMIASFMTANLTVAYVLGAVFNVPLVFAVASNVICGPNVAMILKRWSIGRQLNDFGQGVVSIAGIAYFLMVLVVMLYISMVLIGRRHWIRHKGGTAMAGHYLIRIAALIVVGIGVTVFFRAHDARLDMTSEQINSLSPNTRELLANLEITRPVQIDAFISPTVPESYIQARLNLLAMLRELQAGGGDKVVVRINNTKRFSEEAAIAAKRFGIGPRQITTLENGVVNMDQIFMGVAMTCGLEKVTMPFLDRGLSPEYELVRSIATVTQQKRKKVGILTTDAQLYGRFNMQTFSSAGNWPIVDELEKQYEVAQVDPSKPITEKYDVLLAVQPSSLGPKEMDNFIAAVESGQPTAIFEDPCPIFAAGVPATSAPRQAPGGMNPMMRRQAPPKGDINRLWHLLGVHFSGAHIAWQDYNPYPKAAHFPKEFVFIDRGEGDGQPFNESSQITSGLQQLLFPFPGFIAGLNSSPMEFSSLAQTGTLTGTVRFSEIMQMTPFGPRGGLNPNRRLAPTGASYTLAAQIKGEVTPKTPGKDDKGKAKKTAPTKINVVLVADIDMLTRDFFRLREQGEMPESGMYFNFDNVTFVLDVLDVLADDTRFVALRKRRQIHRSLVNFDNWTKGAREETNDAREKLVAEFESAQKKEQDAIQQKLGELQKRKNIDPQQLLIEIAVAQQEGNRRLQTKVEQLQQKRDRETNRIETSLALKIRKLQDNVKLQAVLLPPILPLILAIFVLFVRRNREKEGVSEDRLRK